MRRSYYLDNLRIFLTALVIFHHTAIAYGGSGGWCYVTPEVITGWKQIGLSSMLAVNQAFFMSLFFFISAYFTHASYERKGFKKYLSDRLIRLGIPLVLYSLVIGPTLDYFIQRHLNNSPGEWLGYVIQANITSPNTSHLWFLFALLLFEGVYAIQRRYLPIRLPGVTRALPTQRTLIAFVLVTGTFAFLLRTVYPIGGKNFIGLQFGYFVLYVSMYLAGLLAGRERWIDRFSFKAAKYWLIAVIMAVPMIVFAWIEVTKQPSLVEEYIGGFRFRSFSLAIWEALLCVGIGYFLLLFFREYLNKGHTVTSSLSADSYGAYIIHPIVVVSITIALERVPMMPEYKLLIAVLTGIALTFLSAHVLRKLPVARSVL